MKESLTLFSRSSPTSSFRAVTNNSINRETSLLGRCQFSLLKAYTVRMSRPRRTLCLTTSRKAATPAL